MSPDPGRTVLPVDAPAPRRNGIARLDGQTSSTCVTASEITDHSPPCPSPAKPPSHCSSPFQFAEPGNAYFGLVTRSLLLDVCLAGLPVICFSPLESLTSWYFSNFLFLLRERTSTFGSFGLSSGTPRGPKGKR